jgi:hypothetical protein
LTGGTPNYFNESKKAILMSAISKKSYFYENVKKYHLMSKRKINLKNLIKTFFIKKLVMFIF